MNTVTTSSCRPVVTPRKALLSGEQCPDRNIEPGSSCALLFLLHRQPPAVTSLWVGLGPGDSGILGDGIFYDLAVTYSVLQGQIVFSKPEDA